jgi:hypothetical protein
MLFAVSSRENMEWKSIPLTIENNEKAFAGMISSGNLYQHEVQVVESYIFIVPLKPRVKPRARVFSAQRAESRKQYTLIRTAFPTTRTKQAHQTHATLYWSLNSLWGRDDHLHECSPGSPGRLALGLGDLLFWRLRAYKGL